MMLSSMSPNYYSLRAETLRNADDRSRGSFAGSRNGDVLGRRSGVRGEQSRTTRNTPSPCSGIPKMYINNNSPGVMDVDSSRTIVEDYIRYRLDSNGLSWQNGQRDVTPNEIQRAMRALGDEFESRFSQAFDDMINHLHITPDTAYQTFTTIVNEIFKDGVNWGRVVALFGFGGKLAVRCVQQSMPQLVCSIVDWVTTYVDTTLKPWIAENNGWAGFLEFYEGGPDKRGNESWPSFKKICSFAAAGLGILTLGAFLSQKS
ncbi:bcl-2-like protein 2 isoform X3 [Littorina saxatilis]|uniref:bcl-2-like protein 2 isoform X3 n=1 Tax=Littorina saxatilis TaxID=31220 RepID=UPI0038B4C15B